ncbi:ATP-dependent Clp protease adapter protein ClpS [Donghicola tyrosinivorans]|uniref:ATP-dependent Clp protease adapter protein ClpS n=2 Tax=Donghicola tyrosinivorans TaxID=1652492 RepID=A0A2T0WQH3_9RHOB|nr:ATP-dependent Clp protease adapter protein ClpS [Donghicola tyrosinivorans]
MEVLEKMQKIRDRALCAAQSSRAFRLWQKGFKLLRFPLYTAFQRPRKGTPDLMTRFPVKMSDQNDDSSDSDVILKTRRKTQRPPMYKVLLLNDDYTPMEFVVHILERFFGLNHAQAFEIMLTVHKKGLAVVGVFSHEIAETKVTQVMDFARRHEHPLQCTMEKE